MAVVVERQTTILVAGWNRTRQEAAPVDRGLDADAALVVEHAGEPLSAGRAESRAPTCDGLWSMMPLFEIGLWVFLGLFAVVPFVGIWVVCALLTMGQGGSW
ncbi:MAG: hypothetical protein FJX77_08130 [Armatimonadetes bacterium]|nr:hypothetical protein [Armatimonadota bacterium]